MGYCIEHEEGTIKIKKENMPKILKLLADYFKQGNHLRWVDGNWDEDDDLGDIWYDLRYEISSYKGGYEIFDFIGEKLGDDAKLFEMIAPYCEDGYLQFAGEDGEHFRFIIKDGKFEEKYANITWE